MSSWSSTARSLIESSPAMSTSTNPDPRTAAPGSSIWDDISETAFRTHLVTLEERTNAIPIRPAVFPLALPQNPDSHGLSLHDEQTLADDFAFLSAIGEGAQSVAAVCIEEHRESKHLNIVFAAADAFDERLKVGLEEVGHILMSSTTPKHDEALRHYLLLSKVTALHCQKLLGRLRSAKWKKPEYLAKSNKKALWRDIDNVIHRVQHIYVKKNHPRRAKATQKLQQFQGDLQDFENKPTGSPEFMIPIVMSAYRFCKSEDIQDFASKLEAISNPTQQVLAALKTLHQLEKIGAYERIAIDLLEKTRRYKSMFERLQFKYLQPYAGVDTDIGYETWARILHVHAEVQLIIHYDMLAASPDELDFTFPRTLGTSKHLCYLCYLFVKHHGRFRPANTHGRLYDQWTIPDLAEFCSEQRIQYKSVIRSMDHEIVDLAESIGPREGRRDAWRLEPMTSRQNLLSIAGNQVLNSATKSDGRSIQSETQRGCDES